MGIAVSIASKVAPLIINYSIGKGLRSVGAGGLADRIEGRESDALAGAVLGAIMGRNTLAEPTADEVLKGQIIELGRRLAKLEQTVAALADHFDDEVTKLYTRISESIEHSLELMVQEYDNSFDLLLDEIKGLSEDAASATSAEDKKAKADRAIEIADRIINGGRETLARVTHLEKLFRGRDMDPSLAEGLVEIWIDLAIRHSDDQPLAAVYGSIERAFLDFLAVQMKGVNVLLEAYAARYIEDNTRTSPIEFLSTQVLPMVRREVETLVRYIEIFVATTMPYPQGSQSFQIDEGWQAMLAAVDALALQTVGAVEERAYACQWSAAREGTDPALLDLLDHGLGLTGTPTPSGSGASTTLDFGDRGAAILTDSGSGVVTLDVRVGASRHTVRQFTKSGDLVYFEPVTTAATIAGRVFVPGTFFKGMVKGDRRVGVLELTTPAGFGAVGVIEASGTPILQLDGRTTHTYQMDSGAGGKRTMWEILITRFCARSKPVRRRDRGTIPGARWSRGRTCRARTAGRRAQR